MLIPRVFWVALGAGAGILAVRRVQSGLRSVTPAGLADRAGAGAAGATESLQSWWSQVRRLAGEREAELRGALGLGDSPEASAG